MNFYPHHIGDYLTATAHLTWLEDCAYRRLLDVYYSREQSIPADVAQACRLVRATSKDERKAVDTVLREFFTLSDGWAHGRCDEEIVKAKYEQHADVRKVLGRTGTRQIFENSPVDDFWGLGPNGDGGNALGKLWMKIRIRFQSSTP